MRGPKSALILLIGFLAATGAGYWISSVIGTEVLRQEAETQLGTLLAGKVEIDRAGLAVQGGLFIQGESVGVYPDGTSELGFRLFADRVVAEVDLLALITGRFRLSGLILEGLTFDIRREASGNWRPLPVQALAGIGSENRSPDTEAYLDFFSAFESVTRTLLAAPIAADRVELRGSRVLFRDESRTNDNNDPSPVVLSLTNLDGLLIHHWLSGEAQLQISGILGDPKTQSTPIDIVGDNDGEGLYRLRISSDALDLNILDPYLGSDSASPGSGSTSSWPDGLLTGSVDYRTEEKKSGTLSIDWAIRGFRSRISLEAGELEIARKRLRLAAVGQLSPDAIRLTGTLVTDDGIGIGLDGEAERPLALSSSMEVGAEINGLSVEHVRGFTKSAGGQGETLPNWLKAGRTEKIGLSGALSLSDWGRLISGQLSPLPREVTLGAELEAFGISPDEGESYEALAGRMELRGDTFLLRRGEGRRNGTPLPAINMRINGFSNLFNARTREEVPEAEAALFPGLDPLRAIFTSPADDAAEERAEAGSDPGEASSASSDSPAPDPPAPPLLYRVRIAHLEHPALPWVLRDADFSVQQSTTKTTLRAASMTWGGVPMEGNFTWRNTPRARLQIVLKAGPPIADPIAPIEKKKPETQEVGQNEQGPESQIPLLPRASGRVNISQLETGLLPLHEFATEFNLVGNSLSLEKIRARLQPRGLLAGAVKIDLDRADAVPVELRFTIEDAEMSRVVEIFDVQPGDITGTLRMNGKLAGELRPERALLGDLAGRVDLRARQGELRRQKLPLLLALAQASEGYNEYAERDSIAYESMSADMHLGENRVVTRNFELEGPLRIYASGTLDVVDPPYEVIGVAGLFLFRGAGQLLEAIPLVKIILPGSERGLVGAYYQVNGTLEQPRVRTLQGRSFAESLPDALEAPYQILRAILSGGQIDEGRTNPDEPR